MDTFKIKKNYLNKIKEFQKHNKLYYEDSSPILSDKEFDNLKEEIIKLEKKYKFLDNKLSPSITIGFKPSKNFLKSKHRVQMLSLAKAFDEKEKCKTMNRKKILLSKIRKEYNEIRLTKKNKQRAPFIPLE